MHTKKIGLTVGTVCIAAAVICYLSLTAPYRYVRRCFYDNREQLERLVSVCRMQPLSGRVDAETAPDLVRMILDDLRNQYQADSKYPVFSVMGVTNDKDGDMQCSVMAWNRRTGGDGYNTRDMYCVYLIYRDDGYDAVTARNRNDRQITKNWYVESRTQFSG